MRGRPIGAFLIGFLAGALSIYYLLWRTGGLLPNHLLALTTKEIAPGPPPMPVAPAVTLPPTPAPAVSAAEASLFPSPALAATPAPLATPSLSGFSLTGEMLAMPVDGARRSDLRDSFEETRRGTSRHEAIDIAAPRGTAVLAAVGGTVAKLFTSAQGGLTIYEFDRGAVYCYYYAHLDRYAEGLHEGQTLLRGERIGYVGTTGDAPKDAPHLHFAIFRLGPEKRWWQGVAVNPYPVLLAAAPKD